MASAAAEDYVDGFNGLYTGLMTDAMLSFTVIWHRLA